MKILPVGADLFHADGQMDRGTDRHMMKLIVPFRNFADAPKNLCERILLLAADCVCVKVKCVLTSKVH